MGDLKDNLYRQRIRGKYHANKNLHFIVNALILIIFIFVCYYLILRFDIINKLQAKNQKTLEEITNCKFDDINYVITSTEGKTIDVQLFVNRFKDCKYKPNTDPEKLGENGNVTYFVYKDNGRQAYELYDLGDGYIKIIQNGEIPAVYQLVETKD